MNNIFKTVETTLYTFYLLVEEPYLLEAHRI